MVTTTLQMFERRSCKSKNHPDGVLIRFKTCPAFSHQSLIFRWLYHIPSHSNFRQSITMLKRSHEVVRRSHLPFVGMATLRGCPGLRQWSACRSSVTTRHCLQKGLQAWEGPQREISMIIMKFRSREFGNFLPSELASMKWHLFVTILWVVHIFHAKSIIATWIGILSLLKKWNQDRLLKSLSIALICVLRWFFPSRFVTYVCMFDTTFRSVRRKTKLFGDPQSVTQKWAWGDRE